MHFKSKNAANTISYVTYLYVRVHMCMSVYMCAWVCAHARECVYVLCVVCVWCAGARLQRCEPCEGM